MKKLISVLMILVLPTNLKAQLIVDTVSSGVQLIEQFFDTTTLEISNVTFTGVDSAVGSFNAVNTNLGLSSGILLTTGTVLDAIGPNNTGSDGCENGMPGDLILTSYCGWPTYDAAIVEFDFVPKSDTLFFKYVFGSEDYPEFVGSQFNDVFIMLLTGPGYADVNIAKVPGDPYPVTVSFINCSLINGEYYVCNDPYNEICNDTFNCPTVDSMTTIQYDGFTVPLPAHAIVVPEQSYHMKIGIADAGDAVYDAAVFLSIENLGSQIPVNSTVNHQPPLSLYPNPVSSFLNVSASSPGQLILKDLSGKMIWSGTVLHQKRLDMNLFPAGTYLLSYSNGSFSFHQKIMKL